MKNIRFVLSVGLLVSSLFLFYACGSSDENTAAVEHENAIVLENLENASYQDGIYTGSATGKKGKVEVTVTIAEGAIAQIEIGDNQETPRYAEKVFEKLPDQIIESQSVQVDAVSGATATSNAVLRAVQDCLEQAM